MKCFVAQVTWHSCRSTEKFFELAGSSSSHRLSIASVDIFLCQLQSLELLCLLSCICSILFSTAGFGLFVFYGKQLYKINLYYNMQLLHGKQMVKVKS